MKASRCGKERQERSDRRKLARKGSGNKLLSSFVPNTLVLLKDSVFSVEIVSRVFSDTPSAFVALYWPEIANEMK